MSSKKNVLGFKKFSDIKNNSKENDDFYEESSEFRQPMSPNLPKNSRKIEKPASTNHLMPQDQRIELTDNNDVEKLSDYSTLSENKKVEKIGRVFKFPKNTNTKKAIGFLESVKIPKKSIWYIMVEKQENQLQMIKYSDNGGVELNRFIAELKEYYINKYNDNSKIKSMIENIEIGGDTNYSLIRNIPLVEVDGKKMITKITEDLIKLLSR